MVRMDIRAALLLLFTLCLALGLTAFANVSNVTEMVDRARTAGANEDTLAIDPMHVLPQN